MPTSGAQDSGSVGRFLAGQFGNPHGIAGKLAGQIMRRRSSNIRRNLWTLELMDLRPADRVLEVSYGPGFALAEICARVGTVAGLDHSATMFAMAARRNRRAIAEGRLKLSVGSADELAGNTDKDLAGPFDKIAAINVVPYWRNPVAVLTALHARLGRDGEIFLTFQPRLGAKTDAAALSAGAAMADQMRAAGLAGISVETLTDLSPVAVCAIGRKEPDRIRRPSGQIPGPRQSAVAGPAPGFRRKPADKATFR